MGSCRLKINAVGIIAGSVSGGRVALHAGAQPGFPVHEHGLVILPQGSQPGALDEATRELPR